MPELSKIVSSYFTSSAMDSTTNTTVTPTQPPPPKGKAGKEAAPPVPTGSVSGRDAVFLLSALWREMDSIVNLTWSEGSEADVIADIHHFLLKQCPMYAAKCVLAPAKLLSADVTSSSASIPIGSVSSCWSASAAPEGFMAALASASKAFANGADYYSSHGGLFSHVTAFLLLGDKKDINAAATAAATAAAAAAAPAAKGAKKEDPSKLVPAAPMESVQPVLTKVMLPRVDLASIEKQLRDVRDKYLNVLPKNVTLEIRACNENFSDLLVALVWLLQNGTMYVPGSVANTPVSPSARLGLWVRVEREIIEKSGVDFSVALTLPREDAVVGDDKEGSGGTHSITVPIHERFMLNLANVLTPNVALDSLLDNDVCQLLRFSLGYE